MIKFQVGTTLVTGHFVFSEPWMIPMFPCAYMKYLHPRGIQKQELYVGPSLLPERSKSNIRLHIHTGKTRD